MLGKVCWLALLIQLGGIESNQLVAYWGQNGAGGRGLEWEKQMVYFCDNAEYDFIIVSFLNIFFDYNNKDKLPSFNLACHCVDVTFSDQGAPDLLNCPFIGSEVEYCQSKGVKVIFSLGGAAGSYGFGSQSDAITFATTVWNLFLGGTSSIRPFGSAVLDGVDLDIEGGSSSYYSDFVRALRSLMNADSSKQYFITAAPQCPYPDAELGDTLSEVGYLLDNIHVQFYNNWCNLQNPQPFEASITAWLGLAATATKTHGSGPKIFIGLPAHPDASRSSDYLEPAALEPIYNTWKSNSSLGGVMIWDAGFDMNNVVDGKMYSTRVKAFL